MSIVTRGIIAHASLMNLLAKEYIPTDPSVLLAVKWEVEDDALLDSTVRRSRMGHDLDVGAVEEIGFEIYRFLSHLVRKWVVGVEKLIFPVVVIV